MRKVVVSVVVVAALVAVYSMTYAAKTVIDMGTVKVADANTAAELTLANKVKLVVTAKGVKFPVGTYTPVTMSIMKRDKAGNVWTAECAPKAFTVEKDQTTTLEVSATINAKAGFIGMRTTSAGRTLDIGLIYASPTGEGWRHEVKMGPTRVPAPQFQITDEKGSVLQTGSFSYG